MHEIYLVKNIFESLEEAFPARVLEISRIELSIGLLSNVQPILLQNAFNAVLEEESQYQHIALSMKMLPVLITCDECGQTTEVKNSVFVCGSCGKPSNNMIQGDELFISKVEFATEG